MDRVWSDETYRRMLEEEEFLVGLKEGILAAAESNGLDVEKVSRFVTGAGRDVVRLWRVAQVSGATVAVVRVQP